MLAVALAVASARAPAHWPSASCSCHSVESVTVNRWRDASNFATLDVVTLAKGAGVRNAFASSTSAPSRGSSLAYACARRTDNSVRLAIRARTKKKAASAEVASAVPSFASASRSASPGSLDEHLVRNHLERCNSFWRRGLVGNRRPHRRDVRPAIDRDPRRIGRRSSRGRALCADVRGSGAMALPSVAYR